MKTAKALGFEKGDFVLSNGMPGILIANANTATPCIEVWGLEHESGSAYAHELRKITRAAFLTLASGYGHSLPLQAYGDAAKKALRAPEVAE